MSLAPNLSNSQSPSELFLFQSWSEWHRSAAMNRFCCFLLCLSLWPGSAHSAELDTRAVAFYYPWYGNPATDGRFANWNHPVAVRGEAPRSFPVSHRATSTLAFAHGTA